MTKRQEFSDTTCRKRWDYAGGNCEYCKLPVTIGREEYHHFKEAADGGDNSFGNCRLICRPCHAVETKRFKRAIAKANRQKAKHIGASRNRPKIQSAGFSPPKPQQRATGKLSKTCNRF